MRRRRHLADTGDFSELIYGVLFTLTYARACVCIRTCANMRVRVCAFILYTVLLLSRTFVRVCQFMGMHVFVCNSACVHSRVCACVCVRVIVRACVRACMRVHAWVRVCARR